MSAMDITPPVAPRGGRARQMHQPEPMTLGTPGSGVLTPNNDRDERLGMRRQSQAKALRKSVGGAGMAAGGGAGAGGRGGMSAEDLRTLYDRVIKLAAENKINKNNAWDIDVIYHMPSIIKGEHAAGAQHFNFQRASCGLAAGVDIYSKRVDSVYETCKETLFGFQGVRAADLEDGEDDAREGGGGSDQGDAAGGEGGEGEGGGARKRKPGATGYLDPNGTLTDADSLRAKGNEATFDADPLFGKTSKLFDEASAAGLLLLNMGVYGDCEVLFDASDVPSATFSLPGESRGKQAADGSGGADADVMVDLGVVAPGIVRLLASVVAAPPGSITPSVEGLRSQLQSARGTGGWGGGDDSALAAAAAAVVAAALAEEAAAGDYGPPAATAAAAGTAAGADARWAGDNDGGYGGGAGGFDDGDDAMDTADGGGGFGSPTPAGADGDAGDAPSAAGGFQVDEDGFAVGPGDNDDDNVDAAGGFGDEGEDGGEDGEDPSELTAWLSSQQRALSAPALASGGKGSAWAGAGFWKYSAKTKSAATQDGVARREPVKRRTKKEGVALRLDSDDEDAALEEIMARKGEPQDTQLRSRPRAKTLLPVDLHLAPSRLFRCASTAMGDVDVLAVWRAHAAYVQSSAAARRRAAPTIDAEGEAYYDGGDTGFDHGDGDDGFEGLGGGAVGAEGDDEAETAGTALARAAAEAAAAAGMLGHGGLALGSDMPEGMFSLLPAPRQVTRLEVNYDRVAKVVDVKALKETLHSSITARLEEAGAGGKALQLPFQDLITGLQERGGDEGPDKFKDASVHLCFICLLHLANDHGMSLTNHGQLDSLSVVPLLR